ncbi:MAG: hypothetical protein JNL97_04885, partial [Verrucomicrobiales bacterium]|nr:hypothetical protein [Verrucomicrobiales bacterium]
MTHAPACPALRSAPEPGPDRTPPTLPATRPRRPLAGLGTFALLLTTVLPGFADTLHVSKLGDDSEGRTWATAFRTLQKALDAVPDARGGHTIVVRPDTYVEANLSPAHPGAAGAYNRL